MAASSEESTYRVRTPASRALVEQAARFIPGGSSRSSVFLSPYPLAFDRASGCRVWDADGNRLLDLTGNHSAVILGYGHPAVVAAVRAQLEKGTAFPGPTEVEVRLARHLCGRVPGLERVRFANSGTEAAAFALRAARAFTGRPLVAKMEGGYGGSLDSMMVSTHPAVERAGAAQRPLPVPASAGLAPGTEGGVLVLPFNDVEGSRRLIDENAGRLAAVIVEPVMGSAGMIAAERDYLHALRDVTRRHGILLIVDEVITFRLAYGGAQEYFGVIGDLSIYGKLVGGGLPLGVFGGRADVMSLFDPSHGRPVVPHPGSYNANPVSLAAGLACLEVLDRAAVARLNSTGESVRRGAKKVFDDASVAAQVTGLGSLFGLHPTERPVRNFRDTWSVDEALKHRLCLGLFNEGVLIDPRGVGSLTTCIGDAEVAEFLDALRAVVRRL
jgi:glutamate-1-semialdehyde 2,1-aminomutase